MQRDLFGYQPLEIPAAAFDPMTMGTGEPGPPRRVIWAGAKRAVASVESLGKTTGRDRGGSSERYVDRHRYRLRLDNGTQLDVYFERRPGGRRASRWWAREA